MAKDENKEYRDIVQIPLKGETIWDSPAGQRFDSIPLTISWKATWVQGLGLGECVQTDMVNGRESWSELLGSLASCCGGWGFRGQRLPSPVQHQSFSGRDWRVWGKGGADSQSPSAYKTPRTQVFLSDSAADTHKLRLHQGWRELKYQLSSILPDLMPTHSVNWQGSHCLYLCLGFGS